jgi:hypothetical protein
MDGEQQVRCPLCDEIYEVGGAYTAHLRDAHDLVDDEVVDTADGPGAAGGALDLGVLAAAAASLAQADEPFPVPPAPAADGQPAPVAPRSPARRRGLAVVLGAAVLAVAVWLAGSGDVPAPVAGDGEEGGLADGGIGPGNGLVEVAGTSAVPPTTAAPDGTGTTAVPVAAVPPEPTDPTNPTDPGTQPRTTRPGRPPSTDPTTSTTTAPAPPPPPPPPTTTPTSVRATEATVVSCTKVAGDRTLVYSFVLSGSTADGRHELTVTVRVSSGPIVVSAVSATEPGGARVVVPLRPGPVICA